MPTRDQGARSVTWSVTFIYINCKVSESVLKSCSILFDSSQNFKLKKVPLKGMKIEIYTAKHYYNVLFNNKVSWNRIHFARLTSFKVFKYDHDIFRVFRYDHDPILGYNDDSLIMLMQAKILYIQITYQYNIFQVSNTFSTNYYNNMYIKSIIS